MLPIRLLSGLPVAEALLDRVAEDVRRGRAEGQPEPRLASLFRDLPATPFRFSARQQEKAAARVGIAFQGEPLSAGLDARALRSRMHELNDDQRVHGVLLEHPLPEALDFVGALSELTPEKDTDGVGITNLGRLVVGRPLQVPAVAIAALEILKYHGISVSGKRVGVVGRSTTVGVPLALLLAARGESGDATVTLAHSKTSDMRLALSNCQIVVSCTGLPGFLTRDVVPEGAIVVDVGLSSIPDPSRPSGTRAVGDADAKSLDGWASALTPVPGGVGPITVAQLMANVVRGWQLLRTIPAS